MRILTRYVLFDLLQVFLLTLTGLTAFIFVALIGKEAVDKGLSLGPLLRMTPYLLPQAMQFAVPGTMLLATTNVYGKMAAANEMVAIKSMGISPWTLAWPTFALASLVSLSAVLLNDIAVSWGRLGVERVFVESIEDVVYGQLRVHRTFAHDKLNITVRRVNGRRLEQPNVTVFDGDEPWVVSAEWAELESRQDQGELVIRLHNVDLEGRFDYVDGGTVEHAVKLDELSGGDGGRSPSTYALGEISSARRRQQAELTARRDDMSAQAALAMMTGDFDQLTDDAWRPHEQAIRGAEYTMHRLGAEPYRRWANGFSCLGFVLVGVPVAVIMRKGEFLASFFMCFAPILLVYYPLLMVSVDKAKGGAIPPQCVWIGNAVLALAGLYLMRRVARY